MAHLIDKDALLAEIERLVNNQDSALDYEAALEDVRNFIYTLEVKEVDFEPDCKIFPKPIECYSTCKECPWLATNNKAQKGEKV